ncbi:orotate phosphoribosyltransferase [Candidatus Woesearchaeota archaeon]|nr:orotate phosphoribosyltransferase [Candidatus Woesearchaeota archaeon]
MSDEKKVAEILLKSNAIILRPSNPFKFVSGILSPVYCDNRLLLSMPAERSAIAVYFVKKIRKENVEADVIAGVATASIPWAALVAEKLKKPMIYVRKEAKDHGRENLIEGKVSQGQKVLVIEDLISTGGSSLSAVAAARKEGAVVENCIAIFTYGMEAARKGFDSQNCKLNSLCNFSILVEIAAEKGYIKKEELRTALEWSRNPEEWAKKDNLQ